MVHARHSGSPQVRNEIRPEQPVRGLDKPVAPGFRQAVSLHHLRGFGVVQIGEFRFDFSAERHDRRLRLACQLFEFVLLDSALGFGRFFIAEIQNVEHRLDGQKREAGERLHFFRLEFQFAQRLFGFKRLLADGEQRCSSSRCGSFLRFKSFSRRSRRLVACSRSLKISSISTLSISRMALMLPAAMRHGGIFEKPHDVRERVGFAQRHQRRGIFLAILLHSADVHIFDRGVSNFLRLENFRELGHARIRHARDAHVRFARLHPRVHARMRQNAEQTCLADLR